MQHTYSFFTNEQECIRAILDLHNGGKEIELDPMYNKGMFYKALIKKPPLRYDLSLIHIFNIFTPCCSMSNQSDSS